MVMKEHSTPTPHKDPEVELHHQMQFSIIYKTPLFDGILTHLQGTQCILSYQYSKHRQTQEDYLKKFYKQYIWIILTPD